MRKHILTDERGVEYVEDATYSDLFSLPGGDWTLCDTCKRAWNDGKSTSVTPAPSGRCPFEYEHNEPVDRPCDACGAESRERCRPGCIGEAAHQESHFAIGLSVFIRAGAVPAGLEADEDEDYRDGKIGQVQAVHVADGQDTYEVHGWYWLPSDLSVVY